jgi:hypothetical protein
MLIDEAFAEAKRRAADEGVWSPDQIVALYSIIELLEVAVKHAAQSGGTISPRDIRIG